MRPLLRLLYLDETSDWTEKITAVTGCIAGIYVYDAHRQTFCCELTPSYEMHLVGYLTENNVSDEVQMQMTAVTEVGDISYIHCGRVDSLKKVIHRPHTQYIDPFAPGRIPYTDSLPGPWPGGHDAAIDGAIEILRQYGYTTT